MKKLGNLIFIFGIMLFIGLVNAADSEASFCCEKTTYGAWCVNDVESTCSADYRSAPTSCETTAYCRLGTCYDSEEGICMGNTPQETCIDSGGTWDDRSVTEVPQCQLGCCIISDQAAFVSLVRCKKLSTFFGVPNNYRTDITSELECIAVANAQDMGACVYDKDFERVCEFTTRGECGAAEEVEIVGSSDLSGEKTFYEGYLCSAEELNTACARQTSTTCYDGDVYWVDSCGNRENVYSANREKSWNRGRIAEPDEVCDANDGDDKDCGNCDYLLGSRCAADGDEHYCKTTECVDRNGEDRINGESWCVSDSVIGNGKDRVGARYYREICVDGEVKVEPCSDYRNEICIESFIDVQGSDDFSTAACRVNRWQDCIAQTEEDDCIDIDKRDCVWMDYVEGIFRGYTGTEEYTATTTTTGAVTTDAFTNPTGSAIAPITGQSIFGDQDELAEVPEKLDIIEGICAPNYSPGLKFWEEGSAEQVCEQASAKCVVVYEKGLLDREKKCVQGCDCLEESWAKSVNEICSAFGDCGGYVNYDGVYTDDGYKWVEDKEERFL